MDVSAVNRRSNPPIPVSPNALVPNLEEINRLKLQLAQIQNMIQSQDELILNVRQNLVRRMFDYLKSVKIVGRSPEEYTVIVNIKQDLDMILKDQKQLIVSIRQDKLKELVELNTDRDKNHSPLKRQLSRSADNLLDIDNVFTQDNSAVRKKLSRFPRVVKVQRSETVRAERSVNFKELAKKSGVVKRNKTMYNQRRRNSVDDIYERLSEIHPTRSRDTDVKNDSSQIIYDNIIQASRENFSNVGFESTKENTKIKPPQITAVTNRPKPLNVTLAQNNNDEKHTENHKCHTDENAMLSADKDFVDIDELIHFTQNHKPVASNDTSESFVPSVSPQRSELPLTTVHSSSAEHPSTFSDERNSKQTDPVPTRQGSTKEPSTASCQLVRDSPSYAVENAKLEVLSMKRDRITIKRDQLSTQQIQTQTKSQETHETPTETSVQSPQNLTMPLDPTDIRTSYANETYESTDTRAESTKQSGQNQQVPLETDNTQASVNQPVSVSQNSFEGDVEFGSNLTVLSALKRDSTHKISPEGSRKEMCAKSDRTETLDKPLANLADAEYTNSSQVVSVLANTGSDYENAPLLSKAPAFDPESPIFESFKEFDEHLARMKIKTSSKCDIAEKVVKDSDQSDYDIPNRGVAPKSKCKPVLLKKPPRKSVKLKRQVSRSLADLSKAGLNDRTRSRPSSFGHDYANVESNVYDVPKPMHIYANIGDIPLRKPLRVRKDATANTDPKTTAPNNELSRKSKAKSHSGGTLAKDAQTHIFPVVDDARSMKKMTVDRSCSVRRSASDNVIYEQKRKRIRQDLLMLSELQDETEETEKLVKALWIKYEKDMLPKPADRRTEVKRSTLPRAAAPNFGRKWKCIIM